MATPNNALALREHSFTKTVLGAFVQRVEADAVVSAGLAAAETAKGVLVSSDADAAALADTAKAIAKAIAALKAHRETVLAVPKMMTTVVDEHHRPKLAALEAGKDACGTAALAYKRQRDAEAEVARKRGVAEAERLAREQRQEEAAVGLPAEDSIPLEAPSAADTRAPIRGGGAIFAFPETLTAELVNVHECDPEWLTFKPAPAIAWLRDAVSRGDVDAPAKGNEQPVEYRGVKFWYKKGVSNR